MESRIEKVKCIIEKIREDCKHLEKEGFLSERGKGQMDVVRLIEEALNE